MMKNTLLTTLSAAAVIVFTGCGENKLVTSPDGQIRVLIEGDSPTSLKYSVTVGHDELIIPSQLGVVTSTELIAEDAKPTFEHMPEVNEEWTQPWGENKTIVNHYNEMAVNFTDSQKRNYTVRFRVFEDGVAFRYEWNAGTESDTVTVTDELTQFALAETGTSWSIEASADTYELPFREIAISDVENANTPFTFRTESQRFGSIHEAALYDYPEMTLKRDSAGVLKAELSPLPNGVKAYVPSRFTTPWRTIQIGNKAVDLINSGMILNLNEPSKIEDTSWIKPQKYVGVWWGMHLGTQTWVMGKRHGATTENAIKYIDFAADNNLQGVLFEGWNLGWENWGGSQHFDYMTPYPDFDLKKIARYANEKGIELWMHNETGGNVPEYEAVLDSTFALYQSLGIHTLKTGYAGGIANGNTHHSQYNVRHYQNVVETAAKYQIMIDAHEPIKDTGIRRTWPNMMTREGARGMEWNAWSDGNDAEYLCILPFTRLLGGPMDYTPGVFDIDYSTAKADKGRKDWNGPLDNCSIHTTLARQIANWVIIYSPLQMAADLIENYEGHPAFQFFRDFNADCDWSKALDGEIGKYIVVARRAGERYYIGAGTNKEARTLSLTLDFLPEDTVFTADIYADDPESTDPEAYQISHKEVKSGDVIEIKMNASGGQALCLTPKK